MIKLTVLGVALLLPMTVLADVAPERDPGKVHVEHHVRVKNLSAYPDWVILVHDAPQKGDIRAHLAFTADSEPEQLLVNGRSWRSAARFSKPSLWLVPKKAWQTWKKETATRIAKQREACAQRGEGCAHISRFQPHYPPPKGAVDCNAHIAVVTQRPAAKGKRAVDVFVLNEAKAGICKVDRTATADKTDSIAIPPGSGPSWWLLGGGLVLILGTVVLAWMLRARQSPVAATA
ncbi:MAG: hypothetical protein ACI9OJ_000383 [Myxococcota bacterium]|jgi:hypothetical protein